eukprot:SM000002S05766  [mRNA]  locus=s2:2062972:2065236:- [translate_table: standard]
MAPAGAESAAKEAHDGRARDFLPAGRRAPLLRDASVVLLYHMLPFTLAPLLATAALLRLSFRAFGWTALAAYFTFMAALLAVPPLYSPSMRKCLQSARSYPLQVLYRPLAGYMLSMKWVAPDREFPGDHAYILACHPHGRMFYSNGVLMQLQSWRKKILPHGDMFLAAADGFFFVPIVRNVFHAVGIVPADRKSIARKLRGGDHVAIMVGGVKEVCLGTSEDTDSLYLLRRKGFIKIAMQENAGVIPIYHFNENELFKHEPLWLLRFWERVNKYINVGAPFMRGIWNLPMPFRRHLLVAIGEPVFHQTGESVDEFHARYVAALSDLYHWHVGSSPRPQQKLVIQ